MEYNFEIKLTILGEGHTKLIITGDTECIEDSVIKKISEHLHELHHIRRANGKL